MEQQHPTYEEWFRQVWPLMHPHEPIPPEPYPRTYFEESLYISGVKPPEAAKSVRQGRRLYNRAVFFRRRAVLFVTISFAIAIPASHGYLPHRLAYVGLAMLTATAVSIGVTTLHYHRFLARFKRH